MMKTVVLFVAPLLLCLGLQAHEVEWLGNEDGLEPDTPVVLDLVQFIVVAPSTGEECTVDVVLDKVTSDYFTAEVLPTNPGNAVWIAVQLLKAPTNEVEAVLSGAWLATGNPDPVECNAIFPNEFRVPIVIPPSPPKLQVKRNSDGQSLDVSSTVRFILQAAQSIVGPWINIAKGTNATVNSDQDGQFFRRAARLGGAVSGTVTDGTGKPHTGLTVGLPNGGASANAGGDGSFLLPGLPWGTNLLAFIKSMTVTDPATGASRTETAGIEVEVPLITPSGFLQFKVEVQVFVIPVCNCTPWCAIGFGTINGDQTPIFFSGGANLPKGVPAHCDAPQVTVTPPSGATFPIRAGSGRHQNSGPNPASGTWTVTTTVCGQSKSCSITFP